MCIIGIIWISFWISFIEGRVYRNGILGEGNIGIYVGRFWDWLVKGFIWIFSGGISLRRWKCIKALIFITGWGISSIGGIYDLIGLMWASYFMVIELVNILILGNWGWLKIAEKFSFECLEYRRWWLSGSWVFDRGFFIHGMMISGIIGIAGIIVVKTLQIIL